MLGYDLDVMNNENDAEEAMRQQIMKEQCELAAKQLEEYCKKHKKEKTETNGLPE